MPLGCGFPVTAVELLSEVEFNGTRTSTEGTVGERKFLGEGGCGSSFGMAGESGNGTGLADGWSSAFGAITHRYCITKSFEKK